MFHSPQEAFILGTLSSSDPWGGLAGLLHIWADELCSRDKDFKKWLEFSAKQDALRQLEMRRWERMLKKQQRH